MRRRQGKEWLQYWKEKCTSLYDRYKYEHFRDFDEEYEKTLDDLETSVQLYEYYIQCGAILQ